MSMAVEPVGVDVFEEVKIGKEKIWTSGKGGSGNTEVSIEHVSTNTYVLEVKDRETSNVVWRFDILKIKSYKIKTKYWHELRYDAENKNIALRFKEDDKNFHSYFEQLQLILKLHNKLTKSRLSIGKDSLESFRNMAIEKMNKGQRDQPSKKQPVLPKDDRPTSGSRSSVAPGQIGDSRPVSRDVHWQLPSEMTDSSDEDRSERSSPTDDPLYNASEIYADASFEETVNNKRRWNGGASRGLRSPVEDEPPTHPPPSPPTQQKCPVENYFQKSNQGNGEGRSDGRQTRRDSDKASSDRSGNILVKPPPPPPPPTSSPKRQNGQKQKYGPVSRASSEPSRPDQNPNDIPASLGRPDLLPHRQQSVQEDPIYGTAPAWRCDICSLMNKAWTVACAVCEWTRTDAWECRTCTKVYSTDLIHCPTCPAWRCRMCTFVNGGDRTTTPNCAACLQI